MSKKINYIKWLHRVTRNLYDHKIMLSVDDSAEVKALFDKELSVEKAVEEIVKKRRT